MGVACLGRRLLGHQAAGEHLRVKPYLEEAGEVVACPFLEDPGAQEGLEGLEVEDLQSLLHQEEEVVEEAYSHLQEDQVVLVEEASFQLEVEEEVVGVACH